MDASDFSRILKPYREQIDSLDERIVSLLVERFGIIREVARIKAEQGIPSVLPDRVDAVLSHVTRRAGESGLDPALARAVYTLLIDHAHVIEESAKHSHRKQAP